MQYATVIAARPRGWALAYRGRSTIVHRVLSAPTSDVEAARREAQKFVGPHVAVIVPRLGERMPDDTTSER